MKKMMLLFVCMSIFALTACRNDVNVNQSKKPKSSALPQTNGGSQLYVPYIAKNVSELSEWINTVDIKNTILEQRKAGNVLK